MPSPRLYHINQDGEMLGEFTEEQARHYLDEGSLHPDDLAWSTGMTTWQPLQILFLTPELPPPPLPAPAAAPSPAHGQAASPANPSVPGQSSPSRAYSSPAAPPPLPHERPKRTIVRSKALPARPSPPELPGKSNLPTPLNPNVETKPPAYHLSQDAEFIPVHLRARHTPWGPLFSFLSLMLLVLLCILLSTHFTGQQELLLRLLPALRPVLDWLTQNFPVNTF